MVPEGSSTSPDSSERAQRAGSLFQRWLAERTDFEALCREHRELESDLRDLRRAQDRAQHQKRLKELLGRSEFQAVADMRAPTSSRASPP